MADRVTRSAVCVPAVMAVQAVGEIAARSAAGKEMSTSPSEAGTLTTTVERSVAQEAARRLNAGKVKGKTVKVRVL